MRLHVNVDHVATLRNARGTDYPNPVEILVERLKDIALVYPTFLGRLRVLVLCG